MSTSSVRPVRLSVCQLNSGEDKEANLKICQSLIEQGKSEGSEVSTDSRRKRDHVSLILCSR